MQELVQAHVTQFFTGLWVTIENIEVAIVDTDINIRVQTPDSALLIWMHGKNIESFQHLLGRILEKIAGHHTHIHLEVNDYMKAKDERLYRFLDSKISLVMSSGRPIRIPNLTSYERKKAHGYISEKAISGLKTRSEGEGAERILHLEYTGEIHKPEPKPYVPSESRPASPTASVISLSEDWVGI